MKTMDMIKHGTPSVWVNILFLIAAICCIAYYLALGIFVRFGQSLDFMWLLLALAFLARFILVGRMIRTGNPSLLPSTFIKILHIGFALFLASVIVIESIIFSAFSQSAPAKLDYIVVLGAKVNGTQPGGALRNRIQVAYEYWQDNPDTVIIASGGQGDDEGISEAQCIFNGLTSKGVPPSSILLEDESTSTYENLSNSLKMITSDEDIIIGIVTNNFHIYRALRIARGLENDSLTVSYYGIPVYTSLISFPHYMFREYFGVIAGWITGKW